MKLRDIPDNEIRKAVGKSSSVAAVLKRLGIYYRSGSGHESVKKRIDELRLDTSHFTGSPVPANSGKKDADSILVLSNAAHRTSGRQLKRALLKKGIPHQCRECGLGPEWNGQPLVLQVDHIDGNWKDCRLKNLRFLCPNCHSQAPTSRQGYITLTCARCEKTFRRRMGLEKRRRKKGQRGPFCGSSCASHQASHREAISWPSDRELAKMVTLHSMAWTARKLGVSDTAVRKRCKRRRITR